jgi:hypothetical protein
LGRSDDGYPSSDRFDARRPTAPVELAETLRHARVRRRRGSGSTGRTASDDRTRAVVDDEVR